MPFDASASTSPSSITADGWDLDGGGAFDDATGVSPSFTYQRAFDGLVGLRVTNSAGRSNIDYSAVHVAEVNRSPTVDSFSPPDRSPKVIVGTSQPFSITTSDADADAGLVERVAVGEASRQEVMDWIRARTREREDAPRA